MKHVRSIGLINERNGWWGLSVWDLTTLAYFLLLSHTALSIVHLEVLAFVITGGAFLILLRIRLRSRPKTIRDVVKFHLTSSIQKG